MVAFCAALSFILLQLFLLDFLQLKSLLTVFRLHVGLVLPKVWYCYSSFKLLLVFNCQMFEVPPVFGLQSPLPVVDLDNFFVLDEVFKSSFQSLRCFWKRLRRVGSKVRCHQYRKKWYSRFESLILTDLFNERLQFIYTQNIDWSELEKCLDPGGTGSE